MEKKLTAQGPKNRKSYTVTLPLEWVKAQKLNQTKTVELNIVQNKIVISLLNEIKEKVVLDAKVYGDNLRKIIPGLYRLGVEEIKIKYEKGEDVLKITKIIETKLIGFQVLEQGKEYLIIRSLTKESEEDFRIILRRIFLLLLELVVSTDKYEISATEANISKLINYCQRIISKKGHSDYQKTPYYYLLLDRLEKLKDEFVWLSETNFEKNKAVAKDVLELQKMLRTSYELIYSFNNKKFADLQERTYVFKQKYKLKESLLREDVYVHNIARILNSLTGDILGIVQSNLL
ncbi:MAG: hypothetical protein WC758_02630 [Candidatus Woesearchaeota archaeon]|jgi:hypothetical protein